MLEAGLRHHQAGQLAEAERFYREVLKLDARHADARHLLGVIADQAGKHQEAVEIISKAIQIDPTAAIYHASLGNALQKLGQLDGAAAAYTQAIVAKPDFVEAHYNLGNVLKALGRLDDAVAAYQEALRFKPDYAQAHANLGTALQALSRLDEAVAAYNNALRHKPDLAEAYSNLGSVFKELGRLDEAVTACNAAIRLKPGYARAHANLGSALQTLGRLDEAIAAYEHAISCNPDFAEAHANLGSALQALGRLDDAVTACCTAIRCNPDFATAHANLGNVLRELGRFDEALAAYERAASLPGPVAEQTLVNRAVLLMERGQADQAEALFEHAVKLFPRSASAWFNRVDLVRSAADDPAIAAMQALLASGAVSPADQIMLHFALGKVFLDLGESDRAFVHFDRGNRMKRALIAYDADATGRWMAKIAEYFPAALLERLAGRGAASSRPIFVVGMPRSGTTLVEQILASHPDIHGAGELPHIQKLASQLGDFPGAIAPAQLAPLGAAYLEAIAALGPGKRHVVDKMPANFFYSGLIRLILPEARIIHCRRDPVDTCLSCYSKLFSSGQLFSYDQAELGRYHRDYRALAAHWRTVLPATYFYEVDYEAVVADLESETRRLLDWLSLPWDPACLEFHRTERPVRTASVNQVRKPVYRSSAGRWRQHAQNLGPLLEALAI
ncbi:MAG TPA: tetratricopeptide repeat protein [Acidocella sp.]|uniref:tetratricopeptide repeat protein n=1 Tax=Acidocella sp. TaxID=50710 RepID=UPI002C8EE0CF|nr:tetratricopeptide repeat protein [Acidocella sp.]HVE23022.1 tetratricopeptide repeat protein [Acidocella sp.]